MEKVTMNCKVSYFLWIWASLESWKKTLEKHCRVLLYSKVLEVWQVGVLNYVNYNIKLCFLEEFGFYLTGCDHHDLGGVKLKQNITSIS